VPIRMHIILACGDTELAYDPANLEEEHLEQICKEKKLKMYHDMYLIRTFELRMQVEFVKRRKAGESVGAYHSYEGQEAIAVGVSACLRDDDYVFSTHRGHGHALAKGLKLKKAVAELLGRETGCSHGRGGSMHLFDVEIGLMGGNGIVGGGLPLALGTGYSAKVRGTDQVTVCYFGDGAASQGSFHESLNMAAIWNYPIIYVCENNLYAATTHFSKQCPIENIADRASSYGIEGVIVDGNDVLEVFNAASAAVSKARDGRGPVLLECKTYRHRTHCMVIPEHRDKEERDHWISNDPIELYRQKLFAEGSVSEAELLPIREKVDADFEEALDFASKSPLPNVNTVTNNLWHS